MLEYYIVLFIQNALLIKLVFVLICTSLDIEMIIHDEDILQFPYMK